MSKVVIIRIVLKNNPFQNTPDKNSLLNFQ